MRGSAEIERLVRGASAKDLTLEELLLHQNANSVPEFQESREGGPRRGPMFVRMRNLARALGSATRRNEATVRPILPMQESVLRSGVISGRKVKMSGLDQV